jgi:hypothetical protein
MRNPLFLLYGLLTLGGFGYMSMRGPSLSNINEVKNVPKSVRENPGVYRSHYSYLPHYFSGK